MVQFDTKDYGHAVGLAAAESVSPEDNADGKRIAVNLARS